MRFGILGLGALAISCGGDSAPRNAGNATVPTVQNAVPTLTGDAALRLEEPPALVIADRAGGSYDFVRVEGVVRLSDGRIVAADGRLHHLFFFDSTGEFRQTVGRRGQGPGEFRSVRGLQQARGDTLMVIAYSPLLTPVFTGRGQFVGEVDPRRTTLPAEGFGTTRWLRTDRALVARSHYKESPPRAIGERWAESVTVGLSDADSSSSKIIGTFPSYPYTTDKWGGNGMPKLSGWTNSDANDSFTFIASFTDYEIRTYDRDARLVRIIRRRWSPRKIDDSVIEEYLTETLKYVRPTAEWPIERHKAEVREFQYANALPPIAWLIADRAGRLWAREPRIADHAAEGTYHRYSIVPSVWSVFDTEGRWLNDVTMPARFLPMEIGSDYVIGVARDLENVETVVMYRLIGGGAR